MRFLQVTAYNKDLLNKMYRDNPELVLASHDDQVRFLVDSGNSAIHILAPHLAERGVNAKLVVSGCYPVQKRWLAEQNVKLKNTSDWDRAATLVQVEAFKPDVLYLQDPITYDSAFVRSLSWRPRLVVGWRAAPIPPRTDWSEFDLLLSNSKACLDEATRRGARHAVYHHPGVPTFISDAFSGLPKETDVIFLGQVGPLHARREKYLVSIAKELKRHRPSTSLALHLLTPQNYKLNPELVPYNHGPLWGREFYKAMATSRVTLNMTIDFSVREAGNMRLFESTGVGAFLLTEHHQNLGQYFEPNREVATFANENELLEKALYYLDHEDERKEITAAGQKRCLLEHSMEQSLDKLMQHCEKMLRQPNASSITSPSSPSPKDAPKQNFSIKSQRNRAEGQNSTQKASDLMNIHSTAKVQKKRIRLKDNCRLSIGKYSIVESELVFEKSSSGISIGDRTFIGNARVLCASKIEIGNDVLIAFDVIIADHDSHSVHFSHRKSDVIDWYHGQKDWTHVKTNPVKIQDKAWIGMRATILEGVTIGEGAVVGACSVVTRDVAPYTVVAGNPARVIRTLAPSAEETSPNPAPMTWEQAVQWLRDQPDQQELVRHCYFDDPLLDAAKRYHREDEWQAVRELLPAEPGLALDVGAGRGISSYALAADGWKVEALEPDPSSLAGAGAIQEIITATGLPINITSSKGERLPFDDDHFDIVHARQVLHHADNLEQFCRELIRVLKPGGVFLATREHVISSDEDLPIFLEHHPLHKLYGGENAFTLDQYIRAIRNAGATLKRVLTPLETPINYFPTPAQAVRKQAAAILGVGESTPLSQRDIIRAGRLMPTPGRLFSFLAEKKSGTKIT